MYTPGYATSTTTGSATLYGNTAYGQAYTNTTYSAPMAFNYVKPGETMTIHMIKGTKGPDAPPTVFDAHEVLRFLAPPPKR